MRKILYPCIAVIALFAVTLAACGLDTTTTLQDITKPYIARYECTQATLGEDDLLKDYDYIRITFLDEKEMELSFKQKDGKVRAKTFAYTYDKDSGELTAGEGALGVKIKERTILKDGAFTVNLPLGTKELILKFEKM
ncbi:MAG: hypothetical protein LUD19_00780 [Clostridia bacterium]|nr:hypothetical protein [Clostridia bacterium]